MLDQNFILAPDEHGNMRKVRVVLDAACDKEYVFQQFDKNVRLDVPWLIEEDENKKPAIICGGAPSLLKFITEIRNAQKKGAVIYACNSAAQVLVKYGIIPEYQVVLDPDEITLTEFCQEAKAHLIASVCQPKLFEMAKNPILWHLDQGWTEKRLEGIDKACAFIGGGVTVMISTLCIAYTKGHRDLRFYGVDSSYKDAFYANGNTLEDIKSEQLKVDVQFMGKMYSTTWDMKEQASLFIKYVSAMAPLNVKFNVYGTGLLPDMFRQFKRSAVKSK